MLFCAPLGSGDAPAPPPPPAAMMMSMMQTVATSGGTGPSSTNPKRHAPRCDCGCVPPIPSLFEMAELRKQARLKKKLEQEEKERQQQQQQQQ